MKHITLVYPDGVSATFLEGEDTYETIVGNLAQSNPKFKPYDDQLIEGQWFDVIGENMRARMRVNSEGLPHDN